MVARRRIHLKGGIKAVSIQSHTCVAHLCSLLHLNSINYLSHRVGFSEIWFFDNYIIPLAHKLKECGVFGASGDEYLTYAVQNRNEWAERGEELCREMVEKTEEMFASDDRYFM